MNITTKKQVIGNKLLIKIVFILLMTLLLMIPNAMIRDLIYERKVRKSVIEMDVAKSYGHDQKILPPVLKVPFSQWVSDSEGNKKEVKGEFGFSPLDTDINGLINTDKRKRSIYEIVVYDSEFKANSKFPNVAIDNSVYQNCTLDYKNAYLLVGVKDPNGLDDNTEFVVNGNQVGLEGIANISCSQLTFVKTETFEVKPEGNIIQSSIYLRGTKGVMIEPIGERMSVSISSKWMDPSFVGTRLPTDYDVNDDGFVSNWSINKYSHSYPKMWTSDNSILNKNFAFGVNLIKPIDDYGKNHRTAKYALLIISLTFGIFFFFEILFKKSIHPIQYTLVGFSLSIFFLLLLSFTEHIGFDKAYLISSLSTTILIVTYAKFILSSKRAVLILSFLLLALFGYIFIILQMKDFALLAGSLALFAVLVVVMILSRNINWYELSKSDTL